MPATGVSFGPSVCSIGVTDAGATTSSPDVELPLSGTGLTQLVLTKYGTDAHVWLPGIGYLNGLQAANFIDSAGTQAGLVDNPVGLAMDAQASLGPELVVNGGFDSATGWTLAQPTSGLSTISGGVLTLQTLDGSYTAATQVVPAVIGKTYLMSITCSSVSGSNPEFSLAASNTATGSVAIRAAGSYTVFVVATNINMVVEIKRSGTSANGSAVFDNISAKEVTGAITATQATTANKPILRRGAVNLLTYSEQFNDLTWTKAAVSIAANDTTSPNGTQTADKMIEDLSLANHEIAQSGIPAYTTATMSVYAKYAGRKYFAVEKSGWGATVFDLLNGTIFSGTGTITPVGNGWFRCTGYYIASPSQTVIYINLRDDAGDKTYTGDGTSGIYIWGAQLERGSTANQYIPTTTAAASSSAGDYYWEFDGVNDSLALSAAPFQMADDHCVVAGANAVAGAAATIFSIGNTASNNDVIAMDYTSNFFRVWWRDTALTVESLASPTTRNQQILVGSMRKTGNTKIGRINGSQYGTGSIVMGSTTLNTSAIGVFSRTTLSAYMTGSIYPVIAIKGTVSDADLLILERWVGQMSDVSI